MIRPTYTLIALYLAAIVIANITVALFGPVVALANAFVFIALDLVARDRLHEAWHHHGLVWKMAALIGAGSLLSYALNRSAGPIALASFLAFGASGIVDTLVYALLGKHAYLVKVNGSNVASAAVDSAVFIGLAFGWLPWLVMGQLAAKVAGGIIWSVILRPREKVAEAL